MNLIIVSGYTFIYLKFIAFKEGVATTLGQLFTAENKASIDKAARDVLIFLIYIIQLLIIQTMFLLGRYLEKDQDKEW